MGFKRDIIYVTFSFVVYNAINRDTKKVQENDEGKKDKQIRC